MFPQAMSSDAEDRLFTAASIGAVRVDNATLSRLRECALYEVCVAGIDRAFLALLASEGFSSMRAARLARVGDVNQRLRALYSNALIVADVDATELHLRLLAGETTIVLAFRLKCYSQRAARDLSDMLLLHYEEHHFGGLPAAFCRLPSTSLGGGECGGYLLVHATVFRCWALHILIEAKSPIYILLLYIFSPRVTRVKANS